MNGDPVKRDLLRDIHNSLHGALPRLRGHPLQSRLNRVNRRVAQRSHCAANQPDKHGLIPRQVRLALVRLQPGAGLRVRGEVDGLVAALAQCGQRDAAVQRADALLLHNRVQRVRRVAVLGDVERVRHRVVLSLQPDLDDFHWRHDGDSFGYAGRETGWGVRLVSGSIGY